MNRESHLTLPIPHGEQSCRATQLGRTPQDAVTAAWVRIPCSPLATIISQEVGHEQYP